MNTTPKTSTPTPTTGAKVVSLHMSTNDDRSLREFIDDLREAVAPQVKNSTVLGAYYLVDGEPVREDGSSVLDGRPNDFRAKPARVQEPEPDPEPKPDPPAPVKAGPEPGPPQAPPRDEVSEILDLVEGKRLGIRGSR